MTCLSLTISYPYELYKRSLWPIVLNIRLWHECPKWGRPNLALQRLTFVCKSRGVTCIPLTLWLFLFVFYPTTPETPLAQRGHSGWMDGWMELQEKNYPDPPYWMGVLSTVTEKVSCPKLRPWLTEPWPLDPNRTALLRSHQSHWLNVETWRPWHANPVHSLRLYLQMTNSKRSLDLWHSFSGIQTPHPPAPDGALIRQHKALSCNEILCVLVSLDWSSIDMEWDTIHSTAIAGNPSIFGV